MCHVFFFVFFDKMSDNPPNFNIFSSSYFCKHPHFVGYRRSCGVTCKNIEREYLVVILIMPERHFHFLSVVADRLQDGPTAWP